MTGAIIAIVLIGSLQILTIFTTVYLVYRYVEHKQAEAELRAGEILRDWLNPQEGDKPSKLANLLDAGGAIIGAAAARSIMASLSADQSHVAKVANGAADELMGQQNPIMGLLSGGKRGRGAAVARLGQLLLPLISNIGSGNGRNSEDKSGGPPPRSFSM